MDTEKRLELIRRNTAEIIEENELKDLLRKKKKPVVYIGVAITGKPHAGYFLWVIKLADFLKAGFKVKLLLADLHGALDKTPWDILEKRYQYYKKVILPMFKSIGANIKDFEIVKGSDFQKSADYFYDVLRMSTYATVHDCKKASSEIVKQEANPKLAGLIYSIMQALDEQYLGVDIQYGGIDQRKVLVFARKHLPKIGYKPRVEIMTPLVPGLIGEKMSASIEESKIDLLDDCAAIKRKLNRAYCPAGVVEGNGILAFLKYVVMVIKQDKKQKFTIKRPAKFGGDIYYNNYEQLKKDFINKKLHPQDLKLALAEEINKLLEPVRKSMKGNEKLIKEAYP